MPPKTLYGYRIGADVVEPEAKQSVKLVPDNRTMIVLPFNDEHDEEIEPSRLKSLKEIFETYKPKREVSFKDIEGEEQDPNVLEFNSLEDFSVEGITTQVPLLQELEQQAEVYARLADVFQNNERLRDVLVDEEGKKKVLSLINDLIEELNLSLA